jgi:hypothetical protein
LLAANATAAAAVAAAAAICVVTSAVGALRLRQQRSQPRGQGCHVYVVECRCALHHALQLLPAVAALNGIREMCFVAWVSCIVALGGLLLLCVWWRVRPVSALILDRNQTGVAPDAKVKTNECNVEEATTNSNNKLPPNTSVRLTCDMWVEMASRNLWLVDGRLRLGRYSLFAF